MKSIILPNSIVRINNDAFRNSSLTKIILSSSLKYIGNKAFCDSPLETIILPDGLEYIGEYAFYNTAIARLIIPDSVKKIDWWAFGNCEKLEYIRLSKFLDQIPSRFCENCINLKDIENIGFCPIQSTAFVGCRKLPIKIRKKLIDAGYSNNF
ncbi:leucine-rich repeat domain-containing protein [Treponema sp. OMZ 791]|uniref:leucine-rich repeat domain-containing protein n=1 Tax=unclassified Treponema TaxID=2638727 RepID=UPI00352FFBE8